ELLPRKQGTIRNLSPVLEEEPVVKPKKSKKPAKKSTTVPTTGVIIRDTLGVSISKNKAPAKVDRGKGMKLLSGPTLLKVARVKEALKKTKNDSHVLHPSGSGDGVGSQPKVLDESEDKTTGTNEGTDSKDDDNDDDNGDVSKGDDDKADSDDDDGNDAQDSIRTDSDEEENPNLNMKEFDDEEYDELFKDVNVRSKVTKHEEVRKGDVEMTDDTHESASQEKSYEQVIEDAHVTLTSLQKIEVSTLEKELAQFKQVDHSGHILTSIKSQILVMVDEHFATRIRFTTQTARQSYTAEFEKKAQEEKDRYIYLIEKSIKDIIKDELREAAASLTEFELKKILLDKIQKSKSYRGAPEHRQLYDVLIKSYKLDKDLFESYGNTYSLKRDCDDKDQDEDLAGSDQGLKKRKTSKDAEPPKGFKSKDSTSNSSKDTKSQPKSSGKSVQAEEPVFENDGKSIDFRPPQTWISIIAQTKNPSLTFDELMSTPIDFSAYVMNNLKIDKLTQKILVGPAFNLLKGICKSFVELEYNLEECYKAVTDRLDKNNPKCHEYPFDLSKPLSLIEAQGRQVVHANYFINKDLEYMKGGM
ncbi:hypothetical protein Tco_0900255, partial [Tanacetum coccineum]